ncbi:hypothetical protein BGZ57DRAFT_851096 [Hyaloscypha finlandica]|nr:hypothetical protein BGZ57DRAFT_851096 [Hyaloscypha finlandica]
MLFQTKLDSSGGDLNHPSLAENYKYRPFPPLFPFSLAYQTPPHTHSRSCSPNPLSHKSNNNHTSVKMRIKKTFFTLYAFILTYGSLVTANPLPDNEVNPAIAASEVSEFVASSGWDPVTPVGYVCCKSIGKDGCQDCNFKQDCPSGKDRQCPAGRFCCGFPSGVYTKRAEPTSPVLARNALPVAVAEPTPLPTLALMAGNIDVRSPAVEEATVNTADTTDTADAETWGFPQEVKACCSGGCRGQCDYGRGCGQDGDCRPQYDSCCTFWFWTKD